MQLMNNGVSVSKTSVMVTIVLVAVVAALVAASPQPGGFRAWIAEVRDGDNDWGWDLLDADARSRYDDDRDAYLADMIAADWEGLDLGPAVDVWSDDGFVQVQAELRSDPTSAPAFLLDRRLVHGVCDGRQPVGIGVYEDRRPFQGGAFGGGGLTGGQRHCHAAFADRSDAYHSTHERGD